MFHMVLNIPNLRVSPWTQDVSSTYIRRSEDVLNVFRTSYVRSVYVLFPGGYLMLSFLKQFNYLIYLIDDPHSDITL